MDLVTRVKERHKRKRLRTISWVRNLAGDRIDLTSEEEQNDSEKVKLARKADRFIIYDELTSQTVRLENKGPLSVKEKESGNVAQ